MEDLPPDQDECGMACPVTGVRWTDAVHFANLLTPTDGLEPCSAFDDGCVEWAGQLACSGYRLPTEAEWEYAARAGHVAVWVWDAFTAYTDGALSDPTGQPGSTIRVTRGGSYLNSSHLARTLP